MLAKQKQKQKKTLIRLIAEKMWLAEWLAVPAGWCRGLREHLSQLGLDAEAERRPREVRDGRQACARAAATKVHVQITPLTSKGGTRGMGGNKSNLKSAISFSGLATASAGRGQLEKEVTCTYLRHTKPHILSPTLSVSFPLSQPPSVLSFERQATHRPRLAHEAAAEH